MPGPTGSQAEGRIGWEMEGLVRGVVAGESTARESFFSIFLE